MKKEITKAIVETIKIKTRAMADSIKGKMDAKEEGWAKIPPNGFACLSQLKSLDLSNIPARLPDPPTLSGMPGLQELHLRRMRLQEFPKEVYDLPQLRLLNISQNSITAVPKEISALKLLEELDLSDNSIMSLPAELGLLESSLHVLKLDGNPLRSIRRPILDRGTKAVLEYLKFKLPAPVSS
ncbi:hypothetical protein L7F22_018060 [Adiantum nelumboides]|nr:hypothetical protein [Adiantum nelumboides]